LVRIRFIGRHLMIKKEFANAILAGEKRSTIRLGILKPKYKELIIHSGGRPIAVVEVEDIVYKKLRDLTADEIKSDGFNDLDSLVKTLRKLYPKEQVDLDSTVTIIRFRLKSIIDPSKDSSSELPPALLARIGLRYLNKELEERELAILRVLTRTNSIRKAAAELTGDPLDRREIRKVLRKVHEKLKSRGLI
jgi:hypothetical protein